MGSEIVHFEIMGSDGAGLAGFYRDVFEWDPVPFEGVADYFGVDGGSVAGAIGAGSEDLPAYVAMYLSVDSVDEHLERIEKAGGITVVPKTVMPGIVTFAMFRDPAGNVMGLAEKETPPVA